MIAPLIPAFALAAAMLAQQQPPAAPPAPSFRIAGIVVDQRSGTPLGKTRVMLAPTTARTEQRTYITAADGHFAFDNLPSGKYSLAADRRGYPGQAFDFHENYASAIVTGNGLDSEHLVFQLKPAGSIRG